VSLITISRKSQCLLCSLTLLKFLSLKSTKISWRTCLLAAINQSRRVRHGGQHCGWCFGWGGGRATVAEDSVAPTSR